jgi:hypothetical protein
MKTNKIQKERIQKLQSGEESKGYYGLYCFFDEYEMDVNEALESFVTDRFLIPENGEVETIINTPESYFNMLIDFLEYLDGYYDKINEN